MAIGDAGPETCYVERCGRPVVFAYPKLTCQTHRAELLEYFIQQADLDEVKRVGELERQRWRSLLDRLAEE